MPEMVLRCSLSQKTGGKVILDNLYNFNLYNFLKIHFNIILSPTPRSFIGPLGRYMKLCHDLFSEHDFQFIAVILKFDAVIESYSQPSLYIYIYVYIYICI